MSKADEMFESLGYKKIETDYAISYVAGKNEIMFWRWSKNIQIISKNGIVCIKELQAINEKVKELRMDKELEEAKEIIKDYIHDWIYSLTDEDGYTKI